MRKNLSAVAWTFTVVFFMALLVAKFAYPDIIGLTILAAIGLLGSLGFLVKENFAALRTRSAAHGLNSVITIVLVLGIIGTLNFLATRYPQKLDLTKNKIHTLSDQTDKTVKGLKSPVKAILFYRAGGLEQYRPMLDNYSGLNPKFETEYVNIDKEPVRAQQAGIRKINTLQLLSGAKESKVDDLTEEKITNALLHLLKDKSPTFCAITGHGERSFTATDPESYDAVKKGLVDQSYVVKEVNLANEGKVPDACDAVAVIGATHAFFPAEAKALGDYFANGGRGIIAFDLNLKGAEFAPELVTLAESWYVRPLPDLIVDPTSKIPSIAIVQNFSKENPITRDQKLQLNFPMARPLEILKDAPKDLKVEWLAQTNPSAAGISDFRMIASGQVDIDKGKPGPFPVAVAVSGKAKDSKAARATRLVFLGSGQLANNTYSRFGGNYDFFLNAASWVLEDESTISIRTKDETPGKVDLSQRTGTFIFLFCVIGIPLLIAIAGIVIWTIRRKL